MTSKVRSGILLALWSLLMLFLGVWITSPKSPEVNSLCSHFPLCPDPLVYLRNMEWQPQAINVPSGLNVLAGQQRHLTLQFDLRGVPSGTPVKVVGVSREWLNGYNLAFKPQSSDREAVLYWDPDVLVTSENAVLQHGKLVLNIKASPDAKPGLSVIEVQVQKAGTRWGSQGGGSFRLRVHGPRTTSP